MLISRALFPSQCQTVQQQTLGQAVSASWGYTTGTYLGARWQNHLVVLG